MEKTYFVSFEGIDGSGKDTQLHRLTEIIREDNNKPFGNKYSNIWITRNPTKITKAGIKISNLIRERDVSGEEATELFVEDRREHTQTIKEVLKHSHVLISRYDLSTLSYQMTQGVDFEKMFDMHKFGEEDGCIEPDITIVFDIPVDVAIERTKGRESAQECFEKKEFQSKIKKNLDYSIEELRKKGRKIIIVNANQDVDKVTQEMVKKIEEVLE